MNLCTPPLFGYTVGLFFSSTSIAFFGASVSSTSPVKVGHSPGAAFLSYVGTLFGGTTFSSGAVATSVSELLVTFSFLLSPSLSFSFCCSLSRCEDL